jgi:site-specific DNA recombinase
VRERVDSTAETGAADREHGRRRMREWNPPENWVISTRIAHPALVSAEDFLAVQGLRTPRSNSQGRRRTYLLAGMLRCRLCGRRMDSHWVNNRPGYRCRHGHASDRPTGDPHRPYLYVREDDVLTGLQANPDLATYRDDRQELLRLLRHHKITIDCDGTTHVLSDAISNDS